MDNFGDHKNTGNCRVDATLRAPLDMGTGSKKKRIFKCPGCGEYLQAKETCRGMECPKCHVRFDPKEQETIVTGPGSGGDKIVKPINKHSRTPLDSDYIAFRKASENKAQAYAEGKLGRR